MKILLFLLILFIIFGCASEPLTPEEQHAREDALIVEREQFWIAYDNCLANHGVVIFKNNLWPILSRIGHRRPIINKWDMRGATCSKSSP